MFEHINHFCIPVHNMEKALVFYRDILGLKQLYNTKVWSELTCANGINIALMKIKNNNNKSHAGIGFSVRNIKKATEILESKNVKIIERCKKQKSFLITKFIDSEGNVLWMTEIINKK